MRFLVPVDKRAYMTCCAELEAGKTNRSRGLHSVVPSEASGDGATTLPYWKERIAGGLGAPLTVRMHIVLKYPQYGTGWAAPVCPTGIRFVLERLRLSIVSVV